MRARARVSGGLRAGGRCGGRGIVAGRGGAGYGLTGPGAGPPLSPLPLLLCRWQAQGAVVVPGLAVSEPHDGCGRRWSRTRRGSCGSCSSRTAGTAPSTSPTRPAPPHTHTPPSRSRRSSRAPPQSPFQKAPFMNRPAAKLLACASSVALSREAPAPPRAPPLVPAFLAGPAQRMKEPIT